MTRTRIVSTLSFVALLVTFAPLAAHAIDSAVKCEFKKLKETGKYGSCRLKAESVGVKKGQAPDFSKCDEKFSNSWGKIEDKAGPGVCPSEADESSIGALVTGHAAQVAAKLSGVRFEDCGDGTAVDHQTGLMWQQTDDAGGLTDKDNTYSWTLGDEEPDGTAFTEFVGGMNGCVSIDGVTSTGGYAGYCDWRLPQVDELASIVDCSFVSPCIDQSVFGATNAGPAWSGSTHQNAADIGWFVDFDDGIAGSDSKHHNAFARGVRSGSCP